MTTSGCIAPPELLSTDLLFSESEVCTSGNTSAIVVLFRPSVLRLLSRPRALGFILRSWRSRRCISLAPAITSSSQRTDTTLELDDLAERVENADADMPEWRDRIDMPDAVDGGRSDEP